MRNTSSVDKLWLAIEGMNKGEVSDATVIRLASQVVLNVANQTGSEEAADEVAPAWFKLSDEYALVLAATSTTTRHALPSRRIF